MKRHVVFVALIWAVLTVIGEALAFVNIYPTNGSAEAEDFDHVFRILLWMGIPVFNFVVAMLAYSFFAFRGKGPEETGEAFHGTGRTPKTWLAVTSALAVVTIVLGLVELRKLQTQGERYGWAAEESTLVIHVQSYQWGWQYDYTAYGEKKPAFSIRSAPNDGKEVVLPKDVTTRFDIDSTQAPYDYQNATKEGGVLHSFWIPAFRMKMDAMPGRTTTMTVTPAELGSYAEDAAFRVQCAELCGLGHTSMYTPVKVVEQAEFDKWLADQMAAATKK